MKERLSNQENKKSKNHGIIIEIFKGEAHGQLETRKYSSAPQYPFGNYVECLVQIGEIPRNTSIDKFYVTPPTRTDPVNSYLLKGRVNVKQEGIEIEGYTKEDLYETVHKLSYEELERIGGYPVLIYDFDQATRITTNRLGTVRPDMRTFTEIEAAKLRLARIPR